MIIKRDKIKYGTTNDIKYDKVPTSIKYDNRLTFFERLLMINFSSCSEAKYTPTIKSLSNQFDVDKKVVERAMVNLKKFGYIFTEGKRENTIIYIHPIPIDNEDFKSNQFNS